ncbi:Oxidative stress-induced growth inhibitor 2, partial [Dissophora globulifera]
MKKFATLKNSIHSQPAIRKDAGCNSAGHVSFHSVFGEGADSDNVQSVKPSCVQCEEKQQAMTLGEYDAAVGALPLCSACAYKGLPDASVSSWNPVTREIVIIMNHGAVIKERVAAVGVFIGKQVHMGFLKGSLATEMFATGDSVPRADPVASMRGRTGRTRKTGRGHVRDSSGDLPVNIPTPPCTPPRSPALRPRGQSTWQKQVSKPKGDGSDSVRSFGPTSAPTSSSQVPVGDEGARAEVQVQQDSGVDANSCLPEPKDDEETRHGESADFGDQGDSEGTEPEDDVDESQVLTLLHPLVSDMYNFRIIPMGKVEDAPAPVSISSSTSSLPMETSPTYPMKPKRCTRLPCYPIRQTNTTSNPALITPAPSTAASCSPSPSSSTCESDSDDNKVTMQVESLFLVNDSKHQGSGSGSSVMKAMSMSCISMPCSPLLGCRIVSTDLPSPPLLTLYSAAASAVASSMAALLPASVSCPISPSESPESLSEASSTALSPSSSTSSLVLLEDEAKNIPSTTKCCSLTLSALKTCTQIRTTDIVATAEERQATAADKEEEDEEEEIAPLMDQSIYAAGAITGSKFVRYVLGNGIAIVADILKREVSRHGDFVQLTRHIQHQLAEAGRDANPISAMFDTLAHPLLDTHRGEYPSFLEWQHPANNRSLDSPDSPPPTPVLKHITTTSLPSSGTDTTGVGGGGGVSRTSKGMSRPHIVLGRGDIGGIWADMEHDHNQTLSYQEHMELPLYSFADFVREHPEIGDENLERPLRSTVSAYYKEYVRYIGIQSNFSNNTVVTGIYHLKDLENHCCCSMDPRHRQNCGGKRHGGVAQPSASESSDESV